MELRTGFASIGKVIGKVNLHLLYCMFANTVCEVSLFYHQDCRLFTNHVSRNEQRYIFQKMIETSHTVLPNIQYCLLSDSGPAPSCSFR